MHTSLHPDEAIAALRLASSPQNEHLRSTSDALVDRFVSPSKMLINEEMYEEEDDDLPMQYRRLTAHLQTQNVDFNRRFQSYLLNHVATRQAVGNAAVDGMQTNNAFPHDAGFTNPGYIKMPQQQQQPAFQGQMMPIQMYNRAASNYRQQPYPMPQSNAQPMQPSYRSHSRPLSVATTQNVPQFKAEHSQSTQMSPIDLKSVDNRRMSLLVHNALQSRLCLSKSRCLHPHIPLQPCRVLGQIVTSRAFHLSRCPHQPISRNPRGHKTRC